MRQQELLDTIKRETGEEVSAIKWVYDLGDTVEGKTYVSLVLQIFTEDGGIIVGKEAGVIEGAVDSIDLNRVKGREGFTTVSVDTQTTFKIKARGGGIEAVLDAVLAYLRAHVFKVEKQSDKIVEETRFSKAGK